MEKFVEIDQSVCSGCGACVKMCPAQILYMDRFSKTAKVSNEKACDRLAGCMRICKSGAIKVRGRMPSLAKILGI
jgi:ferredoxin-type protein NapF